ncbi:MAG: hypothetical protein SynsKO_35760 [Synoicihabitans sp.]
MSEWALLILIFWVFYGLNGFSWQRHPRFFFSASTGRPRARGTQAGWGCYRPGPFSWRLRADDVPFAISGTGITNLPAASSARPTSSPEVPQALPWEAISKVEQKGRKIWVNGHPFMPATGHISVAEINQIARAAPADREAIVTRLTQRWFRVHRVRRLLRLLVLRTELITSANLSATAIIGALSIYHVIDGAQFVSSAFAEAMGRTTPLALGLAGGLHVLACGAVWYQLRKLKRWRTAGGGDSLASALLFPPQALQLRATIADALWPALHPVTAAIAIGDEKAQREFAQNTWRDLHWPTSAGEQPHGLADAILRDYRKRLAPLIEELLRNAGLSPQSLVTAPAPDSPASCAYCPRCHDQFVRSDGECPHGIPLRSMR